MPAKNHTNTAAASKGVPSSLGPCRSQQVTSAHAAGAQKPDQHRIWREKTPCSDSSSLHSTPEEEVSTETLAIDQPRFISHHWCPRREREHTKDEGSAFPRQTQIQLPQSQTDAGPSHYLHTIPVSTFGPYSVHSAPSQQLQLSCLCCESAA